MNDFDYQLEFVVDASWRVIELQDRTPLSPSYGCFHYAYWRDKTSEFPDARFQEAGAALGLLSLPDFDTYRESGRLPPAHELYRAFSAALQAWSASQYDEGCWDEWYAGERGFAATEFTMIAFGLAAHYLSDRLQPDDRDLLTTVMTKAANWLEPRHDCVKSNHEAAAAAALALAWDITGDERYKSASKEKLDNLLSRQTKEGWFPEVDGMDLGYCSVLLDYVMIHAMITNEEAGLPAMRKLLAFMTPHIHPDCTISPEAGLCLNPYVSRLGMGLLAEKGDENARSLVSALSRRSPGRSGLAPYLADDLRLCRWAYLPVVTALERHKFEPGGTPADKLAERFDEGWTLRAESALAAYHDGGTDVYVAAAGGGAVRVFFGGRFAGADLGLEIRSPEGALASAGYARDRQISEVPGGIAMKAAFHAPHFFFPGFLSRLCLRLGSVTPFSSRLLRRIIDRYRLTKGTAINQSAAPIADAGDDVTLERTVKVADRKVTIIDHIRSSRQEIDTAWIRPNIQVPDQEPPKMEDAIRSKSAIITKCFDGSGGTAVISVTVTDGQPSSQEL